MKLPTEIAKGRPSAHSKTIQFCVTLPLVHEVEVGHQQVQQEGEGFRPGCSPLECSRHLRKTSSIRVVVLAVVGLSGAIARTNVFLRGRSQPGTHVGNRKPSVQRSSQRIRISDMADVTDRVSCGAPSALFRDAGK